ncbi:uncharacterized protein TEOVI_000479500 [Trypanosoma equiperdum]|uniref:Uncharacterized protein n=2 Tax=Trypanozoon TaxID=39700 RepID=Q381N3_TRYB2|nr:hypothetical protein, conserved [Trypanosoma brucei brucei TREU927]EAN80498.1 hypothetical protein, conserved [Trypanosoma brucei brucei TREU927]SCU65278.1 hypothetical protein, conserved [Trypanosoma equiperdum]
MPWIHLQSSDGRRLFAPSLGPLPFLSDIDQLFQAPLASRVFHCFRSTSDEHAEEMLVLLHQQRMGGELGDVTIAVGGTAVTEGELELTLDCVLDVLCRTSGSGMQMLLDALSVTSSPTDKGNPRGDGMAHAGKDVLEYDGLAGGNVPDTDGLERRVVAWEATDSKIQGKSKAESVARRRLLARRKALLFFVSQDIVPISFLFCRVGPCTYKSPVSSLPTADRKSLRLLEGLAQCSCQCLFAVIAQSLAATYSIEVKSCEQLWAPDSDALPFVAFFSASGLLCASSSFFGKSDHRDRFLIAALAVEQLSCWPYDETQSGSPHPLQLIHVREISLRCCGGSVPFNVVLTSVGSALCCVLGFVVETQGSGGVMDHERFIQFVRKRLATSRTVVRTGGAIRYLEGSGHGSAETETLAPVHTAVRPAQGNTDIFASHLALCVEVSHPTSRFHELLQEINRAEAENLRAAPAGEDEVPTKATAPPSSCACGCSVCLPFNYKKAGSGGFVWHRDVTTLPLDIMWCVAASHIVVAEAHVRNKIRGAGCHCLFSLICNDDGDGDVVNSRRYGVGWFQHSWHNTLCGQVGGKVDGGTIRGKTASLSHNFHNGGGTSSVHVDCLKVLQGLTSLGGGPRASVKYEIKKVGGCSLFRKKPQINMRQKDDKPVFTSRMTVFPLSVLRDDFCDATCSTLDSDEDEASVMTAFYTIRRHLIKGTTRDSLVQEVLLLEGDEVGREAEVVALQQQQQQQSKGSCGSFSLFHQAAACILEDVWRYATS